MRPGPITIWISILLWLAGSAFAEGLEHRSLRVDGDVTLDYTVVLPHDFDATRTYPTLLALPPGPQNEPMVEAGLNRYWGEPAARRGWLVISPEAPEGVLFFQGSESLIPALLDTVSSEFHVEGGKFHLAGVSNGGRSAFRIALKWPERFQSLTVLPGFPDENELDDLARLRGMPIHMFAGGDDRAWVAAARTAKESLERLGIEAHLEVYPGEGHTPPSLTAKRFMDLMDELRESGRHRPAD